MIPYVAFIILIIVAVRMNEIDLKGALIFTAIFIATPFVVGFFAMPGYISVIVNVILDIVLILKIFGGDVRIRQGLGARSFQYFSGNASPINWTLRHPRSVSVIRVRRVPCRSQRRRHVFRIL